MKKIVSVFLGTFALTTAASANWSRLSDTDTGSRFTFAVRGGFASVRSGSMQNDVGSSLQVVSLTADNKGVYLGGLVPSGGSAGAALGAVDMGKMDITKKLNSMTASTELSVGFIFPTNPRWRAEVAWNHIMKYGYRNENLFSTAFTNTNKISSCNIGDLRCNDTFDLSTGSFDSTLETDLYLVMFYHDFFEGTIKPIKQVIPYIGFGIGYANTTTSSKLIDDRGGFESPDWAQVGNAIVAQPTYFAESENQTSSLAAALAVGASYGFGVGQFFEFGLKLSWIDSIEWKINNYNLTTDSAKRAERSLMSSENNLILGGFIGLRFEF